jgi:hypothetical protein
MDFNPAMCEDIREFSVRNCDVIDIARELDSPECTTVPQRLR